MREYNCDRCGERFATSKPLDAPTIVTSDLTLVGLTTKIPVIGKNGRVVVAELDLCGKCVALLAEWATVFKR